MRTMELTIDDVDVELDIKNTVFEKLKKLFGYVQKPVSSRSCHQDNYEETFWFNPYTGIGLILEISDNHSETSRITWTFTDPTERDFPTIFTTVNRGLPSKVIFWMAGLTKSSKIK